MMTKQINVQRLKKYIGNLYGAYTELKPESREKIGHISDFLRTLELLEIIKGTNAVAVAGMQGVGKSLLIQTLCNFDDVLNVSVSRGEAIPVIVEQKEGAAEKEAYLYYLNDSGSVNTEKIEICDLSKISHEKGKNVCIKLTVTDPSPYFPEGGAFILLPGFEKNYKDEWDQKYNNLISLSLRFSDAVLLVTDNQAIAENSMEQLCDIIKKSGFDNTNSVFAITKCDVNESQNADYAEQLKSSLLDSLQKVNYNVSQDQIICCGQHPFEPEKDELWKQNLIEALNAIAVKPSDEKNREMLAPLIDEILSTIDEIEKDINIAKTENKIDSEMSFVIELDKQNEDCRGVLEAIINKAIENAESIINPKIEKMFEDPKITKSLKDKKFLVWKKSPKELHDAWNDVNKKCKKCILNDKGAPVFGEEINKILQADNSLTLLHAEQTVSGLLLPDNTCDATGHTELLNVRHTQIAALFDTEIEESSKVPGDYYMSETQMAKVVMSEFQTCFVGYFCGSASLNTDDSTALNNYLGNGNLAKTSKKLGEALHNRQSINAAALVSTLDLLDGKADILMGLGKGIASIMESGAGSFIGGAAAVASIGCGVLVYHNNNITLQENGENAAKRAIRNYLFSQKDNILTSYDEAYDKMKEHIIQIDKQKNHIPEKEHRLRVAGKAIGDIRNVCQRSFDA